MIYNTLLGYITFTRRCLVLLADQRALFFGLIGLSCVGALTEGLSISLLVPVLETQSGKGSFSSIPILGTISDHLSGIPPSKLIATISVIMAVVIILRSVVQYFVDMLGNVIPMYLEQKLNMQSFAALMAVEISYINGKEYGDLLNGLGGWSSRVTVMLTNVANLIWNGMVVVVYAVLMLTISWRLTVAAILFALLMSLILRFLTTVALRRASERYTEASTHLSQVAMESLTGTKLIRLAAAELRMTKKFQARMDEFNAARRVTMKIQAVASPLLTGAAGFFICVLLFVSALIHGDDSTAWVGPVLLFLLLLFRLMGPVSNINAASARIVSHIHAFDMLNTFYIETKAQRQPSGNQIAAKLKQGIRFENVSFSYVDDGRSAVCDVTTAVECGTMVAIVGPSGAGKSTLIGLVARLYDPKQGHIFLDGIDLRDFDVRSWRKRIAVVSQDIFIFNDTVANNIAFGHDNATREEIVAAAKLAAADEFVDLLPSGYDTVLGDRGVRLSGGQQQRIAIARAILASPDLLIFDEATSNLDTFTERAIQVAMETMAKNCTLIVIAHRLSTIRRADKVIVMENGRVVEEGKHQELLARRGSYWEMVEHQRLDLLDAVGEVTAEACA